MARVRTPLGFRASWFRGRTSSTSSGPRVVRSILAARVDQAEVDRLLGRAHGGRWRKDPGWLRKRGCRDREPNRPSLTLVGDHVQVAAARMEP
jgi:hypothetical protein